MKLLRCLVFLYCLLAMSLPGTVWCKEWFVRQADPGASDKGDGSEAHPLRTINAAAQAAQPGDVVTVGPGIYHEWVSPARGGAESAPIRYRSVPEHAAIVRGTDVIEADWKAATNEPGVFVTALPQAAFVFGNPFVRPPAPPKKQPEWMSKCDALVLLNDEMLKQVVTEAELAKQEGSWVSSNDGKQLFVHLKGNRTPAKGAIEITTRDRIFAPHRRGLGYISVEGFVFERCATRPGWPQLGAVSTRTGHDWVVRNNIVRLTTGKGIDCGSETWEAESLAATELSDKHILIGGHHLVESNLLTENAQCGIAAWNTDFVRIIGNIVIRNASRGGEEPVYYLADDEAAGIKVHAFRNGVIEGNLVASNSSFGIWLDNGWESARVTRNVCLANRGAGIFVELGFGPILVDHNLSARNTKLYKPYLGDGIYTHDASSITTTHNSLIENANDGVHQIVVSERSYGTRLAEASNETITGNLFLGNEGAAICLPLDSPRSRYNRSDDNCFESIPSFVINNNERRIPIPEIIKSCREQLKAANVAAEQQPDLSKTNSMPKLSLAAWRVVMQMDQNSRTLPRDFKIHVHEKDNVLETALPAGSALPTTPAGPADDFDLLGQPVKKGAAHAGAIEDVHSGAINIWPLPTVTR